MTFVVDASVVIALLANRQADEVLRKRLATARSLHAPHLIDVEVASGIRGLLLGGKLDSDRAVAMLSDFGSLRITRHPSLPYLARVLELRNNLTAYDATYVAMAEGLDLPLMTRDARMAGAVGHRAEIQVQP
ncbi:type II toxin-antitoxin system VapC family toxin [Nocardioides speluncae]|uniref:type II toxin-antitoxin system VapC family toxin n=1 Tax=Nocardioides speluncae TaxID=2670337 RepID=UPI000D688409|nr:type II toxin-antitoxin system VapC family toxin [Nocardioides speluncae]